MEPLPPTTPNQILATIMGFGVGIGAQIVFKTLASAVVGPIALLALLLVPPIATFLFVRIAPGSVMEDFFRGFQLGTLLWFLATLVQVLF